MALSLLRPDTTTVVLDARATARRRQLARRVATGTLLTALASGSAATLGGATAQAAETPEAIAHRGGYDFGTENSVKTLKRAFAIGADSAEFDVQFTKDLRTVVMHDNTMNRTTNCSGTVTRISYKKFRSCELNDGTQAPNIYDMLEVASRAGKDVYLHVRGVDSPAKARKIVRALNKFEMNSPGRATVISTNKSYLNIVKTYGFKGRRGLLFRDPADWNANYSTLLPYETAVTASRVQKAQKAGKRVIVVEGKPTRIADVHDLGLDGYMANNLQKALVELGKALLGVEKQVARLGG
ncbi:MAG: glycerophosphodiester phosphodiesterase [Sporichthyaceae bacterium]